MLDHIVTTIYNLIADSHLTLLEEGIIGYFKETKL